jgi:hypothetical protein
MEKVGKDGVITVDEGKSLQTETEWVEGMQFDRGYLSPYFVTDSNTMEAVLENPYILMLREEAHQHQRADSRFRTSGAARPSAVDHRRRRGRRSPGDAGDQSPAWHVPSASR